MTTLEIGKAYRDGWGTVFTIGGLTKDYPEWVWSIQGVWFRKSDGRKINYSKERGHYPMDKPTCWDLHPCTHNEMLPNPQDQRHVWKCAICGYVYGKEKP